jgi:hypothetical protein
MARINAGPHKKNIGKIAHPTYVMSQDAIQPPPIDMATGRA